MCAGTCQTQGACMHTCCCWPECLLPRTWTYTFVAVVFKNGIEQIHSCLYPFVLVEIYFGDFGACFCVVIFLFCFFILIFYITLLSPCMWSTILIRRGSKCFFFQCKFWTSLCFLSADNWIVIGARGRCVLTHSVWLSMHFDLIDMTQSGSSISLYGSCTQVRWPAYLSWRQILEDHLRHSLFGLDAFQVFPWLITDWLTDCWWSEQPFWLVDWRILINNWRCSSRTFSPQVRSKHGCMMDKIDSWQSA